MNASVGDWPERIHYVCNSGSGVVVNASPLAQAGRGRVVGMTILYAVRDRSRPTPAEEREATGPMNRLARFARERFGIETAAAPGAPDSYKAWLPVLDREARRARELGATLVYNVTGGPRAVPLAALLGASNAVRASVCAVSVSFADRACKRLVFNAAGELVDEVPLPAHGRVGIDALPPLYGYREQDRDGRRRREEFLEIHRGVADCALEAALGWWDVAAREWVTNRKWARGKREFGRNVMSGLHGAVQNLHPPFGLREPPFRVDADELCSPKSRKILKSRAINPVFGAFDGLDGMDVVRDSTGRIERLEFRGAEAARFVGGVWLEAAILGRVRDALRRAPGAEVAAGVRLAVEGSGAPGANAPRDDGELDVAIAIDDQLHVVEAKAVRESGRIGDSIAKLVKIRQELGSQVMRCFLVAPLLDGREIGRGDFEERARKQGVRLLYGPGALDRLEEEIARLV